MAIIIVCGLLLLLCAVVLVLPLDIRGESEDAQRANRQWYRLRRQELEASDDGALLDDVKLRMLEDQQQNQAHGDSLSGGRFPSWLLLPVLALAASALYYQMGAAPDVLISAQLQTLGAPGEQSEGRLSGLIDDIEARASQRPENLHYLALLGRFYLSAEDYPKAANYYGQLAAAAPEDAQALAYAAQARYLAEGRVLSADAQLMAEQALAQDPTQRTALGLLGMAAFEQQQFRSAVVYWQRLLAQEPADSDAARMISGVIAQAQEQLEDAGESADTTASSASTLAVTVTIQIPDGAEIADSDTVFVFARAADASSRMPIAARRLTAGDLPAVVKLDDSYSMAGQKISAQTAVQVMVQVSPDGNPGAANATWLGEVGPLEPSANGAIQPIVLSPRDS